MGTVEAVIVPSARAIMQARAPPGSNPIGQEVPLFACMEIMQSNDDGSGAMFLLSMDVEEANAAVIFCSRDGWGRCERVCGGDVVPAKGCLASRYWAGNASISIRGVVPGVTEEAGLIPCPSTEGEWRITCSTLRTTRILISYQRSHYFLARFPACSTDSSEVLSAGRFFLQLKGLGPLALLFTRTGLKTDFLVCSRSRR